MATTASALHEQCSNKWSHDIDQVRNSDSTPEAGRKDLKTAQGARLCCQHCPLCLHNTSLAEQARSYKGHTSQCEKNGQSRRLHASCRAVALSHLSLLPSLAAASPLQHFTVMLRVPTAPCMQHCLGPTAAWPSTRAKQVGTSSACRGPMLQQCCGWTAACASTRAKQDAAPAVPAAPILL